MRPSTTSLIAAFLALGGLELVTAENAQELKPRFIPKNYKRHITYGASHAVASDSKLSSRQLINSVDSLLESLLGQDTSSSSTSSASPSAASASPVVVVPITLSVDANGVTHTITGTPITTMTNVAQTVAGSASTTDTAASTTTAPSAAAPTATQSASGSSNLLGAVGDTVGSVVSGVGDTVSSVGSAVGDTVSSVGGIVNSVVGSSTSTPIPTSTAGDSSSVAGSSSTQPSSADATSNSSSNLLGGLISDILPTGSSASTTDATQSTIPVSVPAVTPSASSGNLTDVLSSLLSPPVSSLTAVAGNASSALFPGGLTGSVIPTPVPSSAALIPTPPFGSSVIGSSSAVPTVHATSTSASSPTQTSSSTTQSSTTTEVTSTPEPTSDNNWVPSTILVEPPSTTQETSSHETATGTSTPVELPGSISPAGGPVSPPADSTLIQIGFNGKLRYSFVATTPLSSSQIFLYVPLGLQYALQVLGQDIIMDALQPYDNSASTGYIATVALAYVPSDTVNTLSELLHNPNSRLYEQSSESVKTLFSMIDPSIPLLVGQSGLSSGSSSSGSGASNGGSNSGDNSGSNSNKNSDAGAGGSSSTKASSVGIGVGVVAGAAAYGAGMFWVARRYRKKRQLHQRTGSNVEQMSEGRGASSTFTAGGRNSQVSRGSGRMISAPVMAENSLGWN